MDNLWITLLSRPTSGPTVGPPADPPPLLYLFNYYISHRDTIISNPKKLIVEYKKKYSNFILIFAAHINDINNPKYTLFGHNGDQNINEQKFNEPLLNQNKTEHIYLYRVTKTEYIWYGKYKIIDKHKKLHIGKDKIIRYIIILSLQKLS